MHLVHSVGIDPAVSFANDPVFPERLVDRGTGDMPALGVLGDGHTLGACLHVTLDFHNLP